MSPASPNRDNPGNAPPAGPGAARHSAVRTRERRRRFGGAAGAPGRPYRPPPGWRRPGLPERRGWHRGPAYRPFRRSRRRDGPAPPAAPWSWPGSTGHPLGLEVFLSAGGVFAGGLGQVLRLVGPGQDVLDGFVLFSDLADADRQGERRERRTELPAVGRQRLAQFAHHIVGAPQAGFRHQDRELISADAGQQVGEEDEAI